MILNESFYSGKSVVDLAKNLIGKKLCSTLGGQLTSGIIVETEAYRGLDDKACHAFGGRLTARTTTMYKSGGLAYVYLCYGIHPLFNIVSGEEGNAEVILVRALEPLDGIEHMKLLRKQSDIKNLCSGPGKLTKALSITKANNENSLFRDDSKLWIEQGVHVSERNIISGPRVGLSTAQECMNWPWRFRIKNNRYCSKPSKVFYKGYPI